MGWRASTHSNNGEKKMSVDTILERQVRILQRSVRNSFLKPTGTQNKVLLETNKKARQDLVAKIVNNKTKVTQK
jgi:hypothetical protein